MNLLLDTHTLIWLGENSPNLSNTARTALESPQNVKYISTATFWELAIKKSIGKLELKKSLREIILEIQESEAIILPILPAHTLKVEDLLFLHRDPFDRMLISQALTEDLTLVSNETLFDQYGIKRLW